MSRLLPLLAPIVFGCCCLMAWRLNVGDYPTAYLIGGMALAIESFVYRLQSRPFNRSLRSVASEEASLMDVPRFSIIQLQQAQGLPVKAMEGVVASALDISVLTLREWRHAGIGPEYETTVGGLTLYTRRAVLSYVHQHLQSGRLS